MSRAPSNPDALPLWQYSLDSVCVCLCGVCLGMPSPPWAEKGDPVLPVAAGAKWSQADLWAVSVAAAWGFQRPPWLFAP